MSAIKHIHLPSVHIRAPGGTGFDYEEDFYFSGRGRSRKAERIIRLVLLDSGIVTMIRETRDELCAGDVAELLEDLEVLMDEGNPAASVAMEKRARLEFARQLRIANGEENCCRVCGCSGTRACSGGCIWAEENLCSRCARAIVAMAKAMGGAA